METLAIALVVMYACIIVLTKPWEYGEVDRG
jgi:hypothetical protein